ncbi:hypothetical protein BDF20DRAFT_914385 [Mycotypha africana]|uniref:uncharacterized protein n=1 Tax=Mycotypha africana TaxID=64632 RepID=UPI00230043D1|nr:uncharacterized protein BDF20DRAFT_914385 [Mycotypha africana]KAI8975457.1 hypothetical protein BDF20DRAFT_914385 [Mycotypha africana]
MASEPKSTAELQRLAAVLVDSNIPIRLYLRSADLLYKQARVYEREQDLQHAYVLFMKLTNLGLVELPKHPAYGDAENKKNLKLLNKKCSEALETLEKMKPALDKAYRVYIDKLEQQQLQSNAIHRQHIATTENDGDKKSDKTPINTLNTWNLQDALKGVVGVGYNGSERPESFAPLKSTTGYPSMLMYNKSDGFSYQANRINRSSVPPLQYQPSLPPKIPIDQANKSNDQTVIAPILPPKIALDKSTTSGSGPTVDASSERGEPLRTMLLPKDLQAKFLSIAKINTLNKIETCGILAGTLKNNILKVTTLIIPKQTGTSDTCTTENEEELFEIQDRYDLLTFGWIHTHPTQSCFLSSVDLHTHCSYQLMLPEAIAIVCAPLHRPNFGIFRLTDPPGLDIISNCKRQPAFHPHPDLPIYTGALDGGHCHILQYDFKVLDLRNS